MNTNGIGPKALNLQKLQMEGYRIPPFLVFSNSDLAAKTPADLAAYVMQHISAPTYAVRSSALTEDTTTTSNAGQFHTELKVAPEQLVPAVQQVLQQAKGKLGSLKDFSLIVQEYVDADLAGVVFTRNPIGGRELVIEYVEGDGEMLVSGSTTARTFLQYRAQPHVQYPVPRFAELVSQAIAIEEFFGGPQDIEWCIAGDMLYILQSRPITTLSKVENTISVFLDNFLPSEHFYFEKTGVTEVAPRPTPLTFSLLQLLYAPQGPVASAYRQLNITYKDTRQLRVIAGELYVDKERELHSLLPSYTHFRRQDYTPSLRGLQGFFRTMGNQGRLQRLYFNHQELFTDIQRLLYVPHRTTTLPDALLSFFDAYRTIFLVNLAAEFSLRALGARLPHGVSMPEALRMKADSSYRATLTPPQGLVGNSLEVFDTSTFHAMPDHWPDQPCAHGVPKSLLYDAQELQRMREYGRWLAVRHITNIRAYLAAAGRTAADTLFDQAPWEFTPSEELYDGTKLPASLPVVLSDTPAAVPTGEPIGVSSGIATGVLVDRTTLTTTPGEKILLVDDLSPTLADIAKEVQGVLAVNGGMLSHFAIIAREQGVPVVVRVNKKIFPLGATVRINGATGDLTVLSSASSR